MMPFLVTCVLLLVIYLVSKVTSIEKRQRSIAEFLEAQIKELEARQEIPPRPLAYGWFDDG